ncbi:MAG: hypothetical protein M3326_13350 [Actinomycetota bacterium]|nr:hypothetical protein [Actinomycetota bacterium]
MRLRAAATLLVALMLTVGAACREEPRPARGGAADTLVDVDVSQRRQVMDGFGVSERVWDDPHLSNSPQTNTPPAAQDAILDALFGELRLTRLRITMDPGAEPVNDNADPQTADASRFNFAGKRNDAHVDLVKQVLARAPVVFFPSPVRLEPWMTGDDPAEYVEWALTVLLRWRELGVEPPYYSPLNEPALPSGGNRSPQWMLTAVKMLGARMRAAGLRTRLVVPDDLSPSDAVRRASVILADPEAARYVGAIAYHLYGGSDEDMVRLRDLGAAHGIPVWMTEFSEDSYASWPGALGWAATIHHLLADGGVSAVDFLWGFFGSYQAAHSLVSITYKDGVYQGMTRQPTFFVTGQFSRFVAPGFVRVAATSPSDSVLVDAFVGPGREVVIVATNAGHVQGDVSFRLRAAALRGPMRVTRTSRTEQGTALAPLPAAPSGFTTSLPAESVTTFVGSTSG